MNNYIEKVKELLNDFGDTDKEDKVFEKENAEHKFLGHCLNCLEDYEKDLLEKIMIENLSIRKYAKISGFSRNFISKERDRLLKLIAKFFYVQYS